MISANLPHSTQILQNLNKQWGNSNFPRLWGKRKIGLYILQKEDPEIRILLYLH